MRALLHRGRAVARAATGELSTTRVPAHCGEILAVNPAPLFILSGGEPLLRDDLETIAAFASRAARRWSSGPTARCSRTRASRRSKTAGVTGFAVSVDSLDAAPPRQFPPRPRCARGDDATRSSGCARSGSTSSSRRRSRKGNRAELARLVDWAAEQGAVSFNAYFLVPQGAAPAVGPERRPSTRRCSRELVELARALSRPMMVRAKCAPHFMRLVHQRGARVADPQLRDALSVRHAVLPHHAGRQAHAVSRTSPTAAGDLRQRSFADIWRDAPLFCDAPRRASSAAAAGECEYRGLCGGCRARAFAATGDMLAEDPSCSYEPTGDAALIERARPVTYGMRRRPAPCAGRRRPRRASSRIPSFVRGVVAGRWRTTRAGRVLPRSLSELMQEVRRAMPVDFSVKRPFFLGEE